MKITTLFRLLTIGCLVELAGGVVRAGEAEDALAAGQAAAQRLDFDGAIASYSAVIKLNPKDGAAYFYRAQVYGRKGDWAAAIKDCNTSLDIVPNVPGVYLLRALAYANSKDLDRALADANAAIKLTDRDASAYGLRGKILEEQGKADAALADYNQSLQIDPDSAYGYLTRALWYQNRGQTVLATKDLLEALRRSPDDPEILNDVAWNMATSPDATVRNAAKSLQYAGEACDLTHWKNAGYIDTLAAAYAEIGDFEQAVKWQQKAVAMTAKGEHAEELAEHLKFYLKKEPFREMPKVEARPGRGAEIAPVAFALRFDVADFRRSFIRTRDQGRFDSDKRQWRRRRGAVSLHPLGPRQTGAARRRPYVDPIGNRSRRTLARAGGKPARPRYKWPGSRDHRPWSSG